MRYLLPILCLVFVQCSWQNFNLGRSLSAQKTVLDKSGYLYDPKDRSCDGFPRLQVETMPGTCLGLVLPRDRAMDADSKKPFIMPRTILQLPGTAEFLVTDMGGWKDNNGSLYWLRKNSSGVYEPKLLKTGLNKPHGLRLGPDGLVYLGESHQIIRFRFAQGKIADTQLVFNKMPRFKGHMHPLTQFTFDPRNHDLFINSGAPSDHCYVKTEGNYSSCPEGAAQGMGAIYRLPGNQIDHLPPGGIPVAELTGAGLRNSMAMVVHPSGTLIQGENSRDFPELEEPYEEINVIDLERPGFHYGWPYCYDFHGVSPEWRFPENKADPLHQRFDQPINCGHMAGSEPGSYQPPYALIPPHAAPLHMDYYQGAMLGSLLNGKLLMAWHGYQPTGHRLVAYNVDSRGRPKLATTTSGASYSFDTKGGCPVLKPINPAGGTDRVAPYTQVISRWDEIKGVRPKGAPVSFTVAEDGSIWIVEDRENRTILRLAKSDQPLPSSDCEGNGGDQTDPRIELLAWRNRLMNDPASRAGYTKLQAGLFQKYCAGCHGNFKADDIADDTFSQLDFLMKYGWVIPGHPESSKIYGAISQSGEQPPMPPGGNAQFLGSTEGNEILKLAGEWISGLPKDVDSSIKRVKMKETRKVRNEPNLESSKVCGQFDPGSVVYYDQRPAAEIKASGWIWVRTFVVPDDSRLFKAACPYPQDGAFYMAVRKAN